MFGHMTDILPLTHFPLYSVPFCYNEVMLPEKESITSEEEVGVAAISYIPPLFLLFLFWKRWRLNYFTYYHARHALLLNLLNLIALGLGVFTSLLFSNIFDDYFAVLMLSGLMITGSLLMVTFFSFYCLLQAYRGRYVVLPIVTRLYYLLFEKVFAFQTPSHQGATIDGHSFANYLRTRKVDPKKD